VAVDLNTKPRVNQSINQSGLCLLKKKPLLTQTQEGCTIELKIRKTKYASLEIKNEYEQYND